MFASTSLPRSVFFGSAASSTHPQRSVAMHADSKPTVLVTGAGGKTGKLVAQKLKASPDYNVRAVFRTDQV